MLKEPFLICIGGATGAGKTTTGHKLARYFLKQQLICHVIDSDVIRREMLGYDLKYHMQFCDYADEVTEKVNRNIERQIKNYIEKNENVIEVSGFWKPKDRKRIEFFAKKLNANFAAFWLKAPENVLKQRIQKRWDERISLKELSIEQGHASDADIAVLERNSDSTFGEIKWRIIDSNKSTQNIIKELTEQLNKISSSSKA